jgi:hypothetical protein
VTCSDRAANREPENERSFGAERSLSSQRTRVSWIRGRVWSRRFVSSSDGVRGGSASHRHTRNTDDAARRYRKVWHGAPTGTANRASGTASGTTHGTHRAAPGAAHRARRTTGRSRRPHHHPNHHRAKKVTGRSGQRRQWARRSAGRRKALQRAASAELRTTGQADSSHRQTRAAICRGRQRGRCRSGTSGGHVCFRCNSRPKLAAFTKATYDPQWISKMNYTFFSPSIP